MAVTSGECTFSFLPVVRRYLRKVSVRFVRITIIMENWYTLADLGENRIPFFPNAMTIRAMLSEALSDLPTLINGGREKNMVNGKTSVFY